MFVSAPLWLTYFLHFSTLQPDLAVGLSLLPFHLIELGLESLVLIGQHLEPILQGGAFLLVATDQLVVDLILKRGKSHVRV